jgi:hypothetical protein
VFALGTPLVLTCAGFMVLMAVQAFVFGNASALAAGQATHVAGAASAVLGVVQAAALAISAPLASSGGAHSAEPMIWVMLIGVAGSLLSFLVVARPTRGRVARPARRSTAPVRQYLLVANRTLGGPELHDVIRDRISRGPAAFWVLVPATPTADVISDFNTLSCAFPVEPELAMGEARPHDGSGADETRLSVTLGRVRGWGATADGAVGDPDPLTAIDAALADREFDEIVLSTLPPGLSRWLSLDLPNCVRRRTSVPLTVVTARADASV